MGKYTFDITKKTLAVFLIVFFISSLTVTAVSAKSPQSCGKVQKNKTPQAPIADFGATYPTIKFTDRSQANPGTTINYWSWDFGDGNTTNQVGPNPVHTYTDGKCTHTVSYQVGDSADHLSNPISYTIYT